MSGQMVPETEFYVVVSHETAQRNFGDRSVGKHRGDGARPARTRRAFPELRKSLRELLSNLVDGVLN